MSFVLALVLGAFMLAMWCDARLDRLRPSTLKWRVAHVAVACVALQLAAVGAGLLGPDGAGMLQHLVGVFAVLLPAFVYIFVSTLWLLRTLAELGFAGR
jgi:heme O synthase-like polyprenyltransferase